MAKEDGRQRSSTPASAICRCAFAAAKGVLLVPQMLDEHVSVRVHAIPAPQHRRQIELALAGNRLVDVHDEAVADDGILVVSDRRDRPHDIEDMIDTRLALEDLTHGLQVVDVVHDNLEVVRTDSGQEFDIGLR